MKNLATKDGVVCVPTLDSIDGCDCNVVLFDDIEASSSRAALLRRRGGRPRAPSFLWVRGRECFTHARESLHRGRTEKEQLEKLEGLRKCPQP